MSGMLRCKDEEEFKRLLAGRAVRVHGEISKKPATAAKSPDLPRSGSDLEELMASQIRAVGNLPEPIRDQPYLIGRAHRLDFAWPDYTVDTLRIGLEVQGMAHRIKGKFLADIEKRVLGQQQGWLILEVAGEHVRNGKAMEWLQAMFARAAHIDG